MTIYLIGVVVALLMIMNMRRMFKTSYPVDIEEYIGAVIIAMLLSWATVIFILIDRYSNEISNIMDSIKENFSDKTRNKLNKVLKYLNKYFR